MTATPVITQFRDLYDVPALADGQTVVSEGGTLVATPVATSAGLTAETSARQTADTAEAAARAAGDTSTLTSAVGASAGLALVFGGI